MDKTYQDTYAWGVKALQDAGIAEAELDARLLLEHVCGTDRNTLYAHGDRIVETTQGELYASLIGRRAERVPLQYILGEQEFMGLSFLVNESVLIPRQDTECLVEEAMISVMDGDRVLDLCTGSGCILLSIMCYKNDIEGVGTDISKAALEVARRNAQTLGKPALFIESDLFGQVPSEPFDVIVSNPPYIPSRVIDTLQAEVKDHEPRGALDGGEDGLVFYRKIIADAPQHLKRGGRIFLEIGFDQGADVSRLLTDGGFTDVRIVKDFAGLDRVATAHYIGTE
ncbi:MAG: peptide chain release factor N(5)-glutamine methyltransferase [Lachnospiraceae bacterium]|nr:peptide chain release factor N(5)-glutamine methyltransferase [Lachnospiraceae bacterium]